MKKLVFFVILLAIFMVSILSGAEEDCMACHEDPDLKSKDEKPLFVDGEKSNLSQVKRLSIKSTLFIHWKLLKPVQILMRQSVTISKMVQAKLALSLPSANLSVATAAAFASPLTANSGHVSFLFMKLTSSRQCATAQVMKN